MGGDPRTGFQFGLLFNSPSLGGVVYTGTTMSWSIIADDGNQKLRCGNFELRHHYFGPILD